MIDDLTLRAILHRDRVLTYQAIMEIPAAKRTADQRHFLPILEDAVEAQFAECPPTPTQRRGEPYVEPEAVFLPLRTMREEVEPQRRRRNMAEENPCVCLADCECECDCEACGDCEACACCCIC